MKLPKINLKEKVSNAGAAAASKLASAKKFAAVMLALSLVLAIGFLAAPTVRKNSAIKKVGDTVMTDMRLIPEIIAFYDGDSISALNSNPANAAAYKKVSASLSKLRSAGGYDSVMLIVQSGKQYLCAADGLIDSGLNTYGAGSLLSPEKSVKNLLNKIYEGKSGGGVAADVVESRMGLNSACVLMPVSVDEGAIAGVIAVETGVKGAPYHIAGAVNLYIVGGVFAFIALVMALLLFLFIKLSVKTGGDPVGTAAADAAAMKKVTEVRAKKAAEKPAADELNSSNVAQKYPAPDFNDSTDFDTPVIPSLTLPGEEDDG